MIRRRFPEIYAGWEDARRTKRPTIRTAIRVGTLPYIVGYVSQMAVAS